MIRAKSIAAALLAATAAMAVSATTPAASAGRIEAEKRCTWLAQSVQPGLSIESAVLAAAGPLESARPGPGGANLPQHCLVRGVINRRTGAGGREFGIGFELRMPVEWNGRFLFQGGGGLDGQVNPAIGNVASSGKEPALARGFAVVSTDAGHSGSMVDASFGVDQQARVDYAYNALDKVTGIAKWLIAEFYGRPADHSYFAGCSNGGRQAMMAAQRMPLAFDGIVAGDPTIRFSRIGIEETWNLGVLARIAPRDEAGRPILSQAFSKADLDLVKSALLKRCDARDGLADGQIQDWQGCDFDPAMVQCKPGESGQCLSAEKVAVLQDLHRGPVTLAGQSIYGNFNYDTGIAGPAWRGMRLGSAASGAPNSADSTLGLGMFRLFQLTPPDPDFDPWRPLDLDDLLRRVRATAAMADADSPFLSTFVQRAKLITYNGLSDQGLSSSELVDWYGKALAASGPQASDAIRLYLVPGMTHCGGGEATDRFEMLDAIVDWVENGHAPTRIEASTTKGKPLSRPLCPFPTFARYKGGDPDLAESFTCESPAVRSSTP